MKYLGLFLLVGTLGWGMEEPVVTTFHHCEWFGGSGNSPHLFDMSDKYKCDEGVIEISGQWGLTIEYDSVFQDAMGKPEGEPRRATASDYRQYKWCHDPENIRQLKRCGSKPTTCYDGKLSAWDADWLGFSCNRKALEQKEKP